MQDTLKNSDYIGSFMEKKILGVLGGMGPAASARFYTMLTDFTFAGSDGEHMRILIRSYPDIPDRTEFILGKSKESPLREMWRGELELAASGAQVIALPCNTAEYFYNDLQSLCPVPIISAVKASAEAAAARKIKRLGIMATEGSVKARVYQNTLESLGIDWVIPNANEQQVITDIIYGRVKRNLPVDKNLICRIADGLLSRGCDAIVLGCTELSLIPMDDCFQKYNFIDSLAALAEKCVLTCGYSLSPKGMSLHKQRGC
jgi:aspartate racemase